MQKLIPSNYTLVYIRHYLTIPRRMAQALETEQVEARQFEVDMITFKRCERLRLYAYSVLQEFEKNLAFLGDDNYFTEEAPLVTAFPGVMMSAKIIFEDFISSSTPGLAKESEGRIIVLTLTPLDKPDSKEWKAALNAWKNARSVVEIRKKKFLCSEKFPTWFSNKDPKPESLQSTATSPQNLCFDHPHSGLKIYIYVCQNRGCGQVEYARSSMNSH